MTAQSIETVATVGVEAPAHGAELTVPLNRLKASPKNARKTPHSAATIEAFAASIKAKGVLQPPVVEVERNGEGAPTGNFLVTIGEGRRQGLRLLSRRKQIKKTHPVRVIVDDENDAYEISLDKNITREAMHPADQFEAFNRLAVEKGYGPEEIAARFGLLAHVVRQRLRLASVAPDLIAAYRSAALTMDQLMGFAVSEDQERQRQVFAQMGQNSPGNAIRRAMTEAKVQIDERRVRFVGVDAYEAAGGAVLRDLFTEDGAGWLEDVGLLDRLVQEKLEGLAEEAREREGWKWASAHFDFPHGETYSRVYAQAVERSEADADAITALSEEYDRLVIEMEDADELSPERDVRLEEIDTLLQRHGPNFAYSPDDLARSGVIVTLVRTETSDAGDDETSRIPFLKAYTVFNIDQIENLPERYAPKPPPTVNRDTQIAQIDSFFSACGADIRHGGGMAYYAPAPDIVQMPAFESFRDAESYYANIGHEMTHWTKHPTHLDRDFGRQRHGDAGYAREELVAELASAFLCADLGLALEPREDHAAYLASWLTVLGDDKRFIVSAAAHAQRAVDHLHGLQPGAT